MNPSSKTTSLLKSRPWNLLDAKIRTITTNSPRAPSFSIHSSRRPTITVRPGRRIPSRLAASLLEGRARLIRSSATLWAELGRKPVAYYGRYMTMYLR